MHTIHNLINSPYRIGEHLVPARGTLEGVDLTAAQLSLLKSVGYFNIEESTQPAKRGRKPKQETGSDETETRDNDESPSA